MSSSRVLALPTRAVLDEIEPGWRDEPSRLDRFDLIAPDALSGPATLIPHEDMVAVWRATADHPDPWFGLHFAERNAERSIGLLAYAGAHAETIGDAIRALVELQRLADTNNRVSLDDDAGRPVLTHCPPHGIGAWPAHLAEAVVAIAIQLIRTYVADDVAAESIRFQHDDRGVDVSPWFGCPVHYRAPANAIVFDPGLLVRPIRTADHTLFASIVAAGKRQLADLPTEDNIVDEARRVLRDRLGGRVTLDELAHALHTSPRTLQRRLSDAGVTFRRLLDDTRLEVLEQLDPTQKATATAGEVGYVDPGSVRRLKRRTRDPLSKS